jgi:hypothetical protein
MTITITAFEVQTRPRPTVVRSEAKPSVMPSMCGITRRKPKFAAEAVTMITFGPGVSDIAAANRNKGPSNSYIRPRLPLARKSER